MKAFVQPAKTAVTGIIPRVQKVAGFVGIAGKFGKPVFVILVEEFLAGGAAQSAVVTLIGVIGAYHASIRFR